MIPQELATSWFRARLFLSRRTAVGMVSTLLLLANLVSVVWLDQLRDALGRQRAALVVSIAAMDTAEGAPAPTPHIDGNLDVFNRTLGDRRHAVQQIKTLFALADKEGLILREGEYEEAWDENAQMYRYQLALPVKGAYRATWDFAMHTLDAVPFASLDEISFRRDAISDPNVEARVRFTLYLRDLPSREVE